MRRIRAIKQRDITDCGAACLSAILQYYGSKYPVSRIRQIAGTDQRGTSILGLVQAAASFGLQAKAVRGNPETLLLIPVPSIVHVVLPSGLHHCQVLVKVGRKKLVVMDPADGRKHQMAHEEFSATWSGAVIFLTPAVDFKRSINTIPVFTRFLQLARPHRYDLLQAFLGAIVFTLLGFSTAIFIQKLVDDIIEQNNLALLHILGGFMLLLLCMQTIIGIIRNILGFRTGQVMDARLITGYYRHLFYLPQKFFDSMRVGEIVSRVNDAVKIRLFVNDTALGIMLNLLIVIFSVILLLFYYWKLALLVLSVFPVYWLLHLITTHINRKWQRRLMEYAADLESNFVESLQGATTVKRLGLEEYVVAKTETSFFRLMNAAYRSGLYNLYAASSAEFLNRVLTIVVLWVGAWMVMQQSMSVGELLSFYSLIGYFTGPVAWLITSGKNIQDALIAADRLFEITDLELDSEASMPSIELSPENLTGIQFESVNFRYGTRAPVLNNLSLCFPKGEITAVVGESGSGKSTISHLLQHIYPVKDGLITIGSIPLQHFSKESIRNIIGVVPQQVDLFSGTVAENISIGDPAPDLARIINCSHQAGAATFIEDLPEGYFSKIGENGNSLSGGQQQKIAIARALYRQPEVLVMDEATAHLDPLSERTIQNTIRELKANGKTVIIIAHRLSTILAADTIHVLKKGKLELSGTHQELLVQSDYYAALWAASESRLPL